MVNANQDPYSGDTSQQHESHTATPSVSQFINSYVTPSSPVSVNVPPDAVGYKAWTFDPLLITAGVGLSTGVILGSAFYTGQAFSATAIYFGLQAAASGMTACRLGLYDNAGTLLVSADCSSLLSSLTTTNTLAAATIASTPLTASTWYHAAMFFTGTTGPSLYKGDIALGLGLSRIGTSSATSVPPRGWFIASQGSMATIGSWPTSVTVTAPAWLAVS